MTEADSIIRDPNLAVEFTRQNFPPKVQQSMIGWDDYEIFREDVHGVVSGLYSSYEIGMRLRATQREIEQKDGHIRNLERCMERPRMKCEKLGPPSHSQQAQRTQSF